MSIEFFTQLYQSLCSQDNSEQVAANEALTEMVNSPESIKTLFEYFENFGENETMKKFTAILLGRSVNINLEKLEIGDISEVATLATQEYVKNGEDYDVFIEIIKYIYKNAPNLLEIFERSFEELTENPTSFFKLLNILINEETYEKYFSFAEMAFSVVSGGENIYYPFQFLLNLAFFMTNTEFLRESVEVLSSALFSLISTESSENITVMNYTLINISKFDFEFVSAVANIEKIVESLVSDTLVISSKMAVFEYLLSIIPKLELDVEDVFKILDAIIHLQCQFHAENPLDQSISSDDFSPLMKLIPKEIGDVKISEKIVEMQEDECSCYIAIILLESYSETHGLMEGSQEFLLKCLECDSLPIKIQALSTMLSLQFMLGKFLNENNIFIVQTIISVIEKCVEEDDDFNLNNVEIALLMFLSNPLIDHSSYSSQVYNIAKELSNRNFNHFQLFIGIESALIKNKCSEEVENEIAETLCQYLSGCDLSNELFIFFLIGSFISSRSRHAEIVINAALTKILEIDVSSYSKEVFDVLSLIIEYLPEGDERLQCIFEMKDSFIPAIDLSTQEDQNFACRSIELLASIVTKLDTEEASQLIDIITENAINFIATEDQTMVMTIYKVFSKTQDLFIDSPEIIEEEHIFRIVAIIKEFFEKSTFEDNIELITYYVKVLNQFSLSIGLKAFNSEFDFFLEVILGYCKAAIEMNTEETDDFFEIACNFIHYAMEDELLTSDHISAIFEFFAQFVEEESNVTESALEVLGALLEKTEISEEIIVFIFNAAKKHIQSEESGIIQNCTDIFSIIVEKYPDALREDAKEIEEYLFSIIPKYIEEYNVKERIIEADLALIQCFLLEEVPVEERVGTLMQLLPPVTKSSNAILSLLFTLFQYCPNIHGQYLRVLSLFFASNPLNRECELTFQTKRNLVAFESFFFKEFSTSFDEIFSENPILAENAKETFALIQENVNLVLQNQN